MELNLLEAPKKGIVSEKTIGEFCRELSSKAPTPGGGGASAIAAALGASLGCMVGSLTIGKPKYADFEDELSAARVKLSDAADRLVALADKDAEAFLPLSRAFSLPVFTESQREYKELVMERALIGASETPLDIMESIYEAVKLIKVFAEKGSAIAISDAAAGASLCEGAVTAASLNVYINTKAMKNRDKAAEYNDRADKLAGECASLSRQIVEAVVARLRK